MKAIYIKPLTELVTLNTLNSVLEWGEDEQPSNKWTHGGANEDAFFAEEDFDDEYDPFFDE